MEDAGRRLGPPATAPRLGPSADTPTAVHFLPQQSPALPWHTGDPDVKVCMLIVRERKQDSRCSKPKSHGEFDVRM